MNGVSNRLSRRLHAAFDHTAGRKNVTKALKVLRGTLSPDTVAETQEWIRRCYHRPDDISLTLHACDALLGTHGVEGLGPVSVRHGALVQYLNTGDTYAATLVYYRGRSALRCWAVASMGDIAEKMGADES